jgi:tetratricopeptide (TPR) repeat protein
MDDDRILSATLADIYLQQGYIEKAIEIYGKLAKREPKNDFYKKRLSALRKDVRGGNRFPAFKKVLKKKLW